MQNYTKEQDLKHELFFMNSYYLLVTLPPIKKGDIVTKYWIVPRTIIDNDIKTTPLADLNYTFQDMMKIKSYFSRIHEPPAINIEDSQKTPSRAFLRNRWTIRPDELEAKLQEGLPRNR